MCGRPRNKDGWSRSSASVRFCWFLKTTAGWVLLTILLVTRPTYDESEQMIRERGLGTAAGGVVAAVVALIVSDSTALVAIGTVAMVVAAVLQLQHAVRLFRGVCYGGNRPARRSAQQRVRDRRAASCVLARGSDAGGGRRGGRRDAARPIKFPVDLTKWGHRHPLTPSAPPGVVAASVALGRPPAEVDRAGKPPQLRLALALGDARLGFLVEERRLRS